ncbi:MAG: hypothetical protein Q7J44_10610 [Pseudotabrizicola sp.]|nr:hypothetical protein [Pseudotabrizicola sp.]MDO9638983.1 hypothetical protein [Pseudotabrizicola sp.]
MLNKPKNHKPGPPWALILMIAIAAVCFILASQDAQITTAVLTR